MEKDERKRAQELRVDEFSYKKKESLDTIQRLTSQLQSMQEQMNSMTDSGESQEVESNHSGRLFHVCSQPEVIPSSSSMLNRDKRLPFDTWNAPGLQENVFGNQFFYIWFAPKSFSRDSSLCGTKRDRISPTSNKDKDLFRKR